MFEKFDTFGEYWWVLPTVLYTTVFIIIPILMLYYIVFPLLDQYRHDCKAIEKNMTLTKNQGQLMILQDKHSRCFFI